MEEHFRTAQETGEEFQILKSDARCVVVRGGALVVPAARLEEVFGIRMEGKVPVEVAVLLGLLIDKLLILLAHVYVYLLAA